MSKSVKVIVLGLLCLLSTSFWLSAGDLLEENDFNSGTSFPWHTHFEPDTGASYAVKNNQLVMSITKAGKEKWGIQLRHRGLTLEQNHSYTVSFKVKASANCKVYAKLGDAGPPYSEYWNNNWQPYSLTAGVWTQVSKTFTHTKANTPSVEFGFHMGGELAGATPYEIYFDDIYLEDPQYTNPNAGKNSLPEVRVNQVGYFPEGEKIATVVNASKAPLEWNLLDAANKVVANGTTTVFGLDSDSNDHAHLIDFSSYTTEGDKYSIQLPGVSGDSNKSHTFSIKKDIYSQMKFDALAYFYHNRSGIEITMPYAGRSDLARKAGHVPDIAATWPNTGQPNYTKDVTGGWYDAGDHGKYVVNGGISAWVLMNLYEHLIQTQGSAEMYDDKSLSIPEAGNGVSDLLDEIKWQMNFLMKMQITETEDPAKAGMAHHKIHDVKWVGIPMMPHNNKSTRYLAPPTTAATLNLAAAAAQASRLWATIDSNYSLKCLTAAENAWKAALKNPAIYHKALNGGGGEYDDKRVTDEFYWAACELYLTTAKEEYKDYLSKSPFYLQVQSNLGNLTSSFIYDWQSLYSLGTLSLAMVPNNLPASEITKAKNNLFKSVDKMLAAMNEQGYHFPFESRGNYPWGSNSIMINNIIAMAMAYDYSRDEKYIKAMVQGMDYILGRNAMDKCYVTGYGSSPVENPHHRFWAYQADNKYPKPPAGVLSGGPNSSADDPIAKAAFSTDTPIQKYYIDNIESYSTNEITINWNGPLAWVATYLDNYYTNNTPVVTTPTPEPPNKCLLLGDFDNSGNVNIVDSLQIAQYYVGLNPPGVNSDCGDADCNGTVNIIDALVIARYYVGLIPELKCQK